ncbi:uncharacterized protein Dwil_GK17873 [Drosophila willistoni]|uniref:Uncharacterized protein n=1 Tax=Drosophila willistoni TaxID=7260 RepID=B4N5S2_DROWI|nr:uncharacterized protein LOC6646175 [Drosophila willistoni]EDW79711.2 uncharacterized protein Dwil_GK17873 [Drosophila willistoni]
MSPRHMGKDLDLETGMEMALEIAMEMDEETVLEMDMETDVEMEMDLVITIIIESPILINRSMDRALCLDITTVHHPHHCLSVVHIQILFKVNSFLEDSRKLFNHVQVKLAADLLILLVLIISNHVLVTINCQVKLEEVEAHSIPDLEIIDLAMINHLAANLLILLALLISNHVLVTINFQVKLEEVEARSIPDLEIIDLAMINHLAANLLIHLALLISNHVLAKINSQDKLIRMNNQMVVALSIPINKNLVKAQKIHSEMISNHRVQLEKQIVASLPIPTPYSHVPFLAAMCSTFKHLQRISRRTHFSLVQQTHKNSVQVTQQ